MKILQIVQKPQRRGAEVFSFQLSKALQNNGHIARTAYLYPYKETGSLPCYDYDYLLNGQENHRFEKTPGVHPQLLWQLSQIINDFRPDVVQVNGARTVKYGAFVRYLNRNSNWVLIYRNIGEPHDWVRGWQRRFFYKKLVMPQIQGTIGISQQTLQTVKDFYALSVPTVQIANGVDTTILPTESSAELRQRIGTPENARVLLFVGSLAIEKRIDRLLKLAHNIRDRIPDLHLWLVGDGPLRQTLEQQAETLNLTDCIHFMGVQSNVANYMHAADLFTLTSDTEGIPAVILEAGLYGLPIIATRVGGVPECVIPGKTGFLIAPNDEEHLESIALDLLQNPEKRHQIGKHAKTWVMQRFSMDNIAQEYLRFYHQILSVNHKTYRNQFHRETTKDSIHN